MEEQLDDLFLTVSDFCQKYKKNKTAVMNRIRAGGIRVYSHNSYKYYCVPDLLKALSKPVPLKLINRAEGLDFDPEKGSI